MSNNKVAADKSQADSKIISLLNQIIADGKQKDKTIKAQGDLITQLVAEQKTIVSNVEAAMALKFAQAQADNKAELAAELAHLNADIKHIRTEISKQHTDSSKQFKALTVSVEAHRKSTDAAIKQSQDDMTAQMDYVDNIAANQNAMTEAFKVLSGRVIDISTGLGKVPEFIEVMKIVPAAADKISIANTATMKNAVSMERVVNLFTNDIEKAEHVVSKADVIVTNLNFDAETRETTVSQIKDAVSFVINQHKRDVVEVVEANKRGHREEILQVASAIEGRLASVVSGLIGTSLNDANKAISTQISQGKNLSESVETAAEVLTQAISMSQAITPDMVKDFVTATHDLKEMFASFKDAEEDGE